MTPQDLIDLPYAGMAEEELRKSSSWILRPEEHLWGISEEECSADANEKIDAALEILEAQQ